MRVFNLVLNKLGLLFLILIVAYLVGPLFGFNSGIDFHINSQYPDGDLKSGVQIAHYWNEGYSK